MNKKEYLTKKIINIPIYEGKLIFVLSNSRELLRKKLNLHIPEDDGLYAWAFDGYYKTENAHFIVLNPDFPYKQITHGVIAHECLHVANYIANYKGIKLDPNNDEPMTYLIGWITDQIYKFLKINKVKIY